MKLLDYLHTMTPEKREGFAMLCGVSMGHLNNVAYGYKTVGAEIAIAIERESAGAVTVEEMRPDMDWAVVRARPGTIPTTE